MNRPGSSAHAATIAPLPPTENVAVPSLLHRLQRRPDLFWRGLYGLLNCWWHRLKFLLLGKHVSIGPMSRVYGTFRVIGPGRVTIGRDALIIGDYVRPVVFILDNAGATVEAGDHVGFNGTVIHCFRSVRIGRLCNFAAAYISDSQSHALSADRRTNLDAGVVLGDVVFEENVWLAMHTVVSHGVTIGRNSVVGALSMVTKSVPPNSVVFGVPARVVREIPPADSDSALGATDAPGQLAPAADGSPPPTRPLAPVLKLAVSATLLCFLFVQLPPREVAGAMTSASLQSYLAVAVGLVIFLLLGAARVYLSVTAFAPIPFSTLTRLYWRSVAMGAFTPGQVGELSLAYFLTQRGLGPAASLAITAVDRLTTLATLMALAAIGIVLYLPQGAGGPLWTLIAFGGLLALLLYVRPWRKRLRAVVERLAPSALPFFEAFCRFFLTFPGRAAINVLLGLGRWACAAFMLLVLIEPQAPAPVDRLFVLLANAAARLVTYLPVSINGLGVLELGAVELFRRGGIPAELTFAAFIVNRAVYYTFAAAVMLVTVWRPRAGHGRPSAHGQLP